MSTSIAPAVGGDAEGGAGEGRPRFGVDAVWRAGIASVLIGGFALQTSIWSDFVSEGRQGYLVGDWLISYAAGPVRRGLVGEMLRLVVPEAATGLAVLFWLATLSYAALFLLALWATLTVPTPRRWAPLLLSPAFVLFAINDFNGGYRKEVLGLACLALILAAGRIPRLALPLTALAVVLHAVAAFAHEVNALLGPAVALAILGLRRDGVLRGGVARAGIGTVGAASVAALAFAAVYGGSPEIAGGVCDDLVARGFPEKVCVGSMGWLGRGVGDGVAVVLEMLPISLAYVAGGAFALLPFAGLDWSPRRRREVIFAAAAIAPLFLVGVDYGRWIAIGVTVATMFVLRDGMAGGPAPRGMPVVWLLLFLTSWSLPHAPYGDLVVFEPSGLVVLGVQILERLMAAVAV